MVVCPAHIRLGEWNPKSYVLTISRYFSSKSVQVELFTSVLFVCHPIRKEMNNMRKLECFAYQPSDPLGSFVSIQQVRPNICCEKELLTYEAFLDKPLIQDHSSVPLLISFTMICQIRFQCCTTVTAHTQISWCFLKNLSDFTCVSIIFFHISLCWHSWVCIKMCAPRCIFKVGLHVTFAMFSTFLLFGHDLLKILMIYDNVWHLLWILI